MARRSPPRPKSTANLPAGLKKYWAARGVPATASGSTTKKTTSKKRKSTKKKK